MKKIRVDGDLAYIELTQGKEAVIDAADVPLVAQYPWHVVFGSRYPYAAYKGKGIFLLMHRLITGCPAGKVVDHLSHDTLDNRRANLKVCTSSENSLHRKGAASNSSTGIRGVMVATNASGNKAYRAGATVKGIVTRRTFPFTEQGLAAATAFAQATRTVH